MRATLSMAPNVAMLVPAVLVETALLVNTFWLGESWPYVLGVMIQLFVGFIAFTRLLLDAWHAQP